MSALKYLNRRQKQKEKGGFAIRVKPPTQLSENACSIFGIRHADNKIRQAVSCL